MTHPIDTTPEAIAALLADVTPGPWKHVPNGKKTSITNCDYDRLFVASGTNAPYCDARFIAASRELVPALANEIARLTAALEAAQAEVKRLTRDLAEDRFTIVMNGKVSGEFKARAEKAEAERDEARARVAHWQRQSAENWAAFSAMRDHINEHLPMRSSEADLLTGPEFSVSCENVAHDVITALARRDAAMRNEGRKSVKVKPLVWEAANETGTIQDASGFGTIYRVWTDRLTGEVRHRAGHRGSWVLAQTIEAAKAAAQADYESRILATLEPEGGE